MTTAKRTDPELWEEVKHEITRGDKGGNPGHWSARKAQMAVQAYIRRGGGYDGDGPGQDDTDLHAWTEEDWGTKSGEESSDSGERYLPRHVRMILTEAEYVRTTEAKRDGERQFVAQPGDIRDKAATLRHAGPTRDMLVKRARDLAVPGYRDMTQAELLQGIRDRTDENGRARRDREILEGMTRDTLYEIARSQDLRGRSKMTKAELVAKLTR